MKTAERLTKIPPYLFMELRKKINKAKSEGVDVISLAIGDPVEATPPSIIDELCRSARDPQNHRYPTDEEKGTTISSLRRARRPAEPPAPAPMTANTSPEGSQGEETAVPTPMTASTSPEGSQGEAAAAASAEPIWPGAEEPPAEEKAPEPGA